MPPLTGSVLRRRRRTKHKRRTACQWFLKITKVFALVQIFALCLILCPLSNLSSFVQVFVPHPIPLLSPGDRSGKKFKTICILSLSPQETKNRTKEEQLYQWFMFNTFKITKVFALCLVFHPLSKSLSFIQFFVLYPIFRPSSDSSFFAQWQECPKTLAFWHVLF